MLTERETKYKLDNYLNEQMKSGIEGLNLIKLGVIHRMNMAESIKSELDDPVDYLLNKLNIKTIFRFILTHPDCDHLTGLSRLEQEIANNKLTIHNFWSFSNIKVVSSFKSDDERKNWETYKSWEKREFHHEFLKGNENKYFNKDQNGNHPGDGIYILSPDRALLDDADKRYISKADIYNNTSYVLLIKFGLAKIILGGDAFGSEGSTSPANEPQNDYKPNSWQYLLNDSSLKEELKDITLLKASHHGLESGFHPLAVKLMNPKITIISEGEKQDQDVQQRYPNNTLSTRFYGTILAELQEDGTALISTKKYRENHGSINTTNKLGFYYNSKSFIVN